MRPHGLASRRLRLGVLSWQVLYAVKRSDPEVSDADLVAAARAGERWAAEALFGRYASMVNAMAYRLLGRDTDLDDLVQDSFVEALSSLARLQQPEAFGGWLKTIVVFRAGKLIRRRRLATRLGLARGALSIDMDALISPTAPADVAAELRRIYRAVEALPAKLRIPLVLRRVEGLPLDEVATLTKTSLATVKRRIAEAERQLGPRGGAEAP